MTSAAALALALAVTSGPSPSGSTPDGGRGSAADLTASPMSLRTSPMGPLDGGPFRGSELAGAGLGVLVGDALVMGAAYGTYRLFTDGAVSPTATNFRRFGIALAATALLVPPITAALGGRLAVSGRASGHTWKAILLSTLGHAAALAVGYKAAPNYWAIIPVQLAAMSAGTSVGLHWGPRGHPRELPELSAPAPRRDPALALAAPICLDRG